MHIPLQSQMLSNKTTSSSTLPRVTCYGSDVLCLLKFMCGKFGSEGDDFDRWWDLHWLRCNGRYFYISVAAVLKGLSYYGFLSLRESVEKRTRLATLGVWLSVLSGDLTICTFAPSMVQLAMRYSKEPVP